MSKVSQAIVTSKFETGDRPVGPDFAELIENSYNKNDGTGTQFLADDGNYKTVVPMVIKSLAATGSVYNDLLPTAVYPTTGAAAPNITVYPGSTTLKCQEFTNGTAEEFSPTYQFPHQWKEGSAIVPHLHLAIPDDGTGGTITMNMTYQWVNHDDAGNLTETTITGSIVRTPNAGVNNNAILAFPPITDATKRISSLFTARITRDLNDTFVQSVWMKSADIHIEYNSIGSDTPYTK